MLLILTYHRIVENPGEIKGFFDVCAGELETHVQAALQIWGRAATPADLQNEQRKNDSTRTGFLVTFDDGTEDHYFIAAPLLERHGLRGVFFVNTAHWGADGYLTLAQCRELQARGHAIESHAHQHKTLVGLPEDQLRSQLTESRQRLCENGLGQWSLFAPPGGFYDAAVVEAARTCGYRSLRTVNWGYNKRLNPFAVESIIINRRTAGGWFRLLASPNAEAAKKAVFRVKETVKHGLPSAYSFFR
ncbi:MAG: polysaccharide deacetylase family protein [Terracidiphilus sp.]